MKNITLQRILVFLILNFIALLLGGLATNQGVVSDWYHDLSKAPWTPQGWVFGVAWTTIMICYAIYMAFLLKYVNKNRQIFILYICQWLLNVIWNPVFFYFHHVSIGLAIIFGLTAMISYTLFSYIKVLKWNTIFIIPYFLWMFIASSLNFYIWIYN